MSSDELDTLHAFFLTIRENKHTLSRKCLVQTLAALTELAGLRARVSELAGERDAALGRVEELEARLSDRDAEIRIAWSGEGAELKARLHTLETAVRSVRAYGGLNWDDGIPELYMLVPEVKP